MGYRREERVPLQVPALVSGLDRGGRAFIQQARTLDISSVGARISGLTYQLDLGSILSVQLGDRKARFQVLWVGEPGSERDGEIGLKCVEVGTHTKRRLLHVDDEEFEIEARRGFLELAGYEVASARSGRAAVDQLRNYTFDAVILDYPLHDLDCGELVEAIKRNAPQTKIIILSVYPGRIPEAVLALADAFIHKGESRQKLLVVLGETVGPGSGLKWPLVRSNSRFAICVPVKVKVFRSGNPLHIVGTSIDLNETGMGAVLDQALLPGENITVAFRLPMSEEVFEARATVRRRSGSQYGFEFVSIDPQQQEAIRALCQMLPPLDIPQPV
ncbi:MAG TPA: PilZ domain-containing protein [Clostridia bacterium]|nr:PilZ domain-containing protein [Clostridia bacterium]